MDERSLSDIIREARENFVKGFIEGLNKVLEITSKFISMSDEELERFAKKERHRRKYYRMMERRKR